MRRWCYADAVAGLAPGGPSACTWLRRILPLSVLGSSCRNSTDRGTRKSSRWRPQWRMHLPLGQAPVLGEDDDRPDRLPEDRVGDADHGRLPDARQVVQHVSTSLGLTFSPRVLMMSSLRLTK